MKSKKTFLYTALLAIFAFISGCNDDEIQGPEAAQRLKVYNIINSGCLSNIERGEVDAVSPLYYEKLRLKALEDGLLQIGHDSVSYNCAAKIDIRVAQLEHQILVTEKDISNSSVRCFCPYNLKYEIPLSYGMYTIKINEGNTYTFRYHARTDTVIVIGSHFK